MRIEQLEYVTAVTQHGSLRRASQRLHISQPALSEAVTKLERELGVTLLDRRRSGARISRRGRELLQNMAEVLEAVDRLRTAAGDQAAAHHVVRVGTVSAATATLLVPAVRDLRGTDPGCTVEVVSNQPADIHQGLLDGALDLGLVNVLEGDDPPTDVVGTSLVHGRPVAVLPAHHPLTAYAEVTTDQLRAEPFVAMREGYLMHRFANRLFGPDMPSTSYTTHGAELGKVMVAEGLGLAVLPDYSVAGDPLERAGLITARRLANDSTSVSLVLQQRRLQHVPRPVRDLEAALVARARAHRAGTDLAEVTSQSA
ncbi:LysR family transcriptional regulator [Nocardioides sp. HB32]